MSAHGKTKDERFIISVYELVHASGDDDLHVDRYAAGASVGITERGVNAICKLLQRANFIIKVDDKYIQLTPHGKELALTLLRSS